MLSVAESSTRTAGAVARTRYARIPEVLPIPNLIELQLDSFEWFIEKGLRELFDEISPIKDFTGKVMELQFLDYEFGDPKYSEEECRTKDLTFSRPLYVNVELLIKETGEIQRQRVYMGDYPWMTDQGTFVINGAERVVVSQLVRSPGVYYSELEDPASGRMLFSRQGHPEPRRLARVRDEQQGPALGQGRPQAQDRGDDPAPRRRLRGERRDQRPVRDRRHGSRAPVHREHPRQGPHPDPAGSPHRGLQEAPPGRSAHRRQRPPARREPVLQLPPLRPRSGRPLQVQQEARRGRRPDGHRAAARGADDHPRGHRRDRRPPHRAQPRARPEGRHRPPRQPPHPGQRRADPERVPDRPPPDGARRPRADDDPGDRQGDPERPHQHPPGRGGDEGVLRRQPAQPVHGPDEPAGRAHLEAAPQRPRPGRPLARARRASTSATSTTATTAGSARSRRRKVRTSA